MGLCVLTASLRKPDGRQHSIWTAVGLHIWRLFPYLATGEVVGIWQLGPSDQCLRHILHFLCTAHITNEKALRETQTLRARWL